jgi:peroxiredoxin
MNHFYDDVIIRNMQKIYLTVVVVLILAMCCSCKGGGAKVGLPAPPLILKRVGGGEVDLVQLKGKVVLVNFWATWCEPCRAEMPDFEKLYRKMEGKPFELLAVSVDMKDEKVKEMARGMNLSFPILHDPSEKSARTWGTIMFPETYLIGPDGVIADKFIGAKDWASEEIVNKLEKLMPR